MIVVDSNIVAYCWLNGEHTATAQRARLKDPDWQVPLLWRSEVRNILSGYVRRRDLSSDQAIRVMHEIERELEGCEHLVTSDVVLRIASTTKLSAYDAEFVALARSLSVPLLTAERAVLRECSDVALSLGAFLDRP